MPQDQQLQNRVFRQTNLPYVTNNSPTSTDTFFGAGSFDILTSIAGYCQRRPGFADTVETTPTVFHDLQRIFPWDRFDGTFFLMACDIDASGFSNVYKLQVGTDASFVLIYTEAVASSSPYDFVVSNNTLYFANGFYVKKWNPVIGVQNWGIGPGFIATIAFPGSVTATAGLGVNVAIGGDAWVNPNNVTSAVAYATTTGAFTDTENSDNLQASTFGFSVPPGVTITGITVTCEALTSFGGNPTRLTAILSGNISGSQVRTNFVPSSNSTLTFGGPADMWGTTASYVNVNDATFSVIFQASPLDGTLGQTVDVRNVQVTINGSGNTSITLTPGSLTASVGYQYVESYGNSLTGHIGSPSPPSILVKPTAEDMVVPVTASTDPQVDLIHIYRTTDSATGLGGQSYFEIPNSPVPNVTGTVTDSATDLNLNLYSLAPLPTFNDPPPLIQGMVYFSGRIWGFIGNQVWFSGLEETTVGVPEESFPSGVAGNFWSFDEPVKGLGVAGTGDGQILGTFCGGRLYGITGNTLDTFRRFLISNRRGARNKNTITTMGGMCAWLDSANQIWATNGTDIMELSVPIRPDLLTINQSTCSMTFHTAGMFHWLVFSTGEELFVYDIDTEQWMPPWTFLCHGVFSGETSAGNYQLMAAQTNSNLALQLDANAFNDNGATYQPVIVNNLMSVIPDYGSKWQGMYDEPSRTGYPVCVQLDTNDMTLGDILYEVDDDPSTATFQTFFANKQDSEMVWNRTAQAVNIKQQIFPVNGPASRWFGLKIIMSNTDSLDKIYSWFLAYKGLGGR